MVIVVGDHGSGASKSCQVEVGSAVCRFDDGSLGNIDFNGSWMSFNASH